MAIAIIAVGFSEESSQAYDEYWSAGPEGEVSSAKPSEVAASPVNESKQSLSEVKDKVHAYYKKNIAGDEYGAYEWFRSDAVLSYSMNIAGDQTEFSLRLDDDYGEADTMFQGYEIVSSSYEITEISMASLEVKATFRQRYRWDGYEGTMTANEVFKFESAGNQYYVVSFNSNQTY